MASMCDLPWREIINRQPPQRIDLLGQVAQRAAATVAGAPHTSVAELTVQSLVALDGAGRLGDPRLCHSYDLIGAPDGETEQFLADVAHLLGETSRQVDDGASRFGDLAERWREWFHQYWAGDMLTVAAVAIRNGVDTQAVHRWLRERTVAGERPPGGPWRLPAAQFDRRSAATKAGR